MNSIEKVLDTLCVICTLVFFLATAVMILGQAVCIITLNGTMSAGLLSMISQKAGIVSAVTTVIAIILAYMRGQMKG